MAEQQGKTKQGKTLAAFIQRNVGRFSELVSELEDMKWQLQKLEKTTAKLKNKPKPPSIRGFFFYLKFYKNKTALC